MLNSYIGTWRKTFTIKGTTNRRDYWIFKIINWIILCALLANTAIWLFTPGTEILFMLSVLADVIFIIFYFVAKTTLLIRRFHDLNVNTETAVVLIIGKYLTGPIGLLIDLILFGATIFPSNKKPLSIQCFSFKQNKPKKKKRKNKKTNKKANEKA